MKGGEEVLNDLVWSVFQGYKKVKDERCPYKELENSWRLYEVDELEELRKSATTKEQHETILDHMYKFNATEGELGYFKRIEDKIIKQYWEG
jgi:hypothetical protein